MFHYGSNDWPMFTMWMYATPYYSVAINGVFRRTEVCRPADCPLKCLSCPMNSSTDTCKSRTVRWLVRPSEHPIRNSLRSIHSRIVCWWCNLGVGFSCQLVMIILCPVAGIAISGQNKWRQQWRHASVRCKYDSECKIVQRDTSQLSISCRVQKTLLE